MMLHYLSDMLTRWRDRPDPGLDQVASKFGTKPIRPEWRHYDEEKGLAGARRGRQQTETGRPIRQPRTRARKTAPVLQMLDRRQA